MGLASDSYALGFTTVMEDMRGLGREKADNCNVTGSLGRWGVGVARTEGRRRGS
jgi:hypothetical protein